MQGIVFGLLFVGLLVGANADCEIALETALDTCNDQYETELQAIFDGFDENSEEEAACTAVYELLEPILDCMEENAAFDSCTEEEIEELEEELSKFYNESCVDHKACLVDNDKVIEDLEACFEAFNETLYEAFAHLDDDFDFESMCSTFGGGLTASATCFEDAIDGHICSDEAIWELIAFQEEFEYFYEDTCENEDFNSSLITHCGDPVDAFFSFAYCFGEYLYDYEGYEFEDGGRVVDTISGDDECAAAFEYIYDAGVCIGAAIEAYECDDDVIDLMIWLIEDASEEFVSECGDDYFDDFSLESTTAESAESAGNKLHFQSVITLLTAFVAVFYHLF